MKQKLHFHSAPTIAKKLSLNCVIEIFKIHQNSQTSKGLGFLMPHPNSLNLSWVRNNRINNEKVVQIIQ